MNNETFYITAAGRLNSLKFPNYKVLARCLLAQAQFETANFTSSLYTRANNCFGYSYDTRSKWQTGNTTATDGKMATYKSWYESLYELCDYLERRHSAVASIQTPEVYSAYLKSQNYYGTSTAVYTAGMKKYFDASILYSAKLNVLPDVVVSTPAKKKEPVEIAGFDLSNIPWWVYVAGGFLLFGKQLKKMLRI